MNPTRSVLCAAALAGTGVLCGCEIEEHREPVHHVYYEEPGPIVEYDYTYYDGGWYSGPYWYYRDRDGHEFHELREEHERRERERHTANFRETHPPAGVQRREVRSQGDRRGDERRDR